MMDVGDVLRDRMQPPAGLERMVGVSIAVHAVFLAGLLLMPGQWFAQTNQAPRAVMTISLGGVMLTFYTNDTMASGDYAARAKQVLDMFDQNKDGYLEASEVPESLQPQLGRFEAVDLDEDGKAYAHEIEAFLAQQQAALKAQIHAKVFDREDLLFAALDADHDDRLDSREIEGAAQRLVGSP